METSPRWFSAGVVADGTAGASEVEASGGRSGIVGPALEEVLEQGGGLGGEAGLDQRAALEEAGAAAQGQVRIPGGVLQHASRRRRLAGEKE